MLASAQITHTSASPSLIAQHPYQVRLEKQGERPAFYAQPPRAIGNPLRTRSQIRIAFANGSAVSFDAETGIVLHRPNEWQHGERIVIVIDKVGFTSGWRLVAMRQAQAESEGMMHCALGGFDLDASGAVLADSFYDIVEAQDEIDAAGKYARLVDMLVHNKELGYSTTLDDIKAAGLSDAVTMRRYTDAIAEAERRTADRDIAASAVEYDRADRVSRLANLLFGHFEKDGEGWDVARRAGFPSRELGDIWLDATSMVGQMLEKRAAGAH